MVALAVVVTATEEALEVQAIRLQHHHLKATMVALGLVRCLGHQILEVEVGVAQVALVQREHQRQAAMVAMHKHPQLLALLSTTQAVVVAVLLLVERQV